MTRTFWDMSPNEAREWLDGGNVFKAPFGKGHYVARRIPDDDSYVVYPYEYSTFGQMVQHSARFGPDFSQNARGVDGDNLYDLSHKEQKERLDSGEIFAAAIARDEAVVLRKTPDQCYIQYIPERSTFEELRGRMAQYAPAWFWEAVGETT